MKDAPVLPRESYFFLKFQESKSTILVSGFFRFQSIEINSGRKFTSQFLFSRKFPERA